MFVSLSASNLYAQDERVRLSGTASIAAGDGGPAPSLSIASGFQLAPHAGFEIEALYIPDQQFGRSDVVVQAIFPVPRVDIDGRTMAFLSSFVTDLQAGRLRPYALFGGGMANVQRRVAIDYGPRILTGSTRVSTASANAPIRVDVRPIPVPAPQSIRTTISENDLVFTAGVGLDIRVWKRLSVAADVRYLHLFQTTQGSGAVENLTRIGARAAYWF